MASITLSKLFPRSQVRNALILLALTLISWLSWTRTFERYELQTYDWRFHLRGARPFSEEVVLVHIWDDTLATLGRWPFDRQYHAALIQVLSEAGAKAIVFDVEFVEPHDADAKVAEAAERAGNVYFAFGFSSPRSFSGRYVSTKIESPVLPEYERAAAGTGFVNIQVDMDGKRRRVMPVINYWGKDHYQLSFRVLMGILGLKPEDVVFKPGKYIELKEGLRVPLDTDGCLLINYAGLWKETFTHYSYVDILSSYSQKLDGEKPILDLEKLRGKICIIGLTAQGTHDTNPNPLEPVYPGVGTYANVVNSILQRDFIRRLDPLGNLLLLLLMVAGTAFVMFYKRPLTSFLYTLATLTIFTAVVLNLFIYAGLWVDLFYPVLVCALVYAVGTLARIMSEMRKRELMESELKIASQIQKSFLPPAPPEVDGLKMAVFMQPAKAVGGDLYTFLPLGEGRTGVMVGDVSGKGTPAALFMGKVVSEFKFSARDRTDPAEVLSKLNDSVASESTGGLFVTLTYAIFDLAQKKMTLSNGGHLPVVVARPDGRVEQILGEGGMPIGVMPGVPFANYEAPIRTGECYAFYSDGISEARNRKKDEFGVETLERSMLSYYKKTAQEILDLTLLDVTRFMGKAEQHDDMTLIIVKIS